MPSSHSKRIVVVGSGVAGLTCALSLIELGHQVTIVTKSQTSDSATWYAQGGVASAMFPDDTTQSHIEDTMIAGAGLCDLEAVSVLVNEGADAVRKLITRGAHFDTLADGSYARTREGGHHNSRIIHAGGDATGEEIERSLVKAASDSSLSDLRVIDYHMVSKLLTDGQRCLGVECVDANGHVEQIDSDHVVLATGGAGQLYSVTTNPVLATADGIALALDVGVLCADLEFMQFHPTALHVDNMPRPLLSEALRGEGSILRDENGFAFMKGVHPLADLAPRDVVSKEIARVLKTQELDHVFLDATGISDFPRRFPTIFASCEIAGIDPTREFLPVSPAAHYFCGGIVTDVFGATSLSGLWAAGEVACNGIHGANRLASNSLLDGLVFGERVAKAIHEGKNSHSNSGVFSGSDKWDSSLLECRSSETSKNGIELTSEQIVSRRRNLQSIMTQNVGVVRTRETLDTAAKEIDSLLGLQARTADQIEPMLSIDDFSKLELEHLLSVSKCVIESAVAREESRGCHTRDDFPESKDSFLGRFVIHEIDEKASFVPMNIPG